MSSEKVENISHSQSQYQSELNEGSEIPMTELINGISSSSSPSFNPIFNNRKNEKYNDNRSIKSSKSKNSSKSKKSKGSTTKSISSSLSNTQQQKKKISLFEEIQLPPWVKWYKYSKFPYKMLLHILLTIFVTISLLFLNYYYSGYSRSIKYMSNFYMYPIDYDLTQLSTMKTSQYNLYEQDMVVYDSNYLVDSYFNLSSSSLNAVKIYSSESSSELSYNFNDSYFSSTSNKVSSTSASFIKNLEQPKIEIETLTNTTTYYLTNSTSYWPLSVKSIDSQVDNDIYLRSFFNNLKKITFHFEFFSHGSKLFNTNNGVELCFKWRWSYVYDFQGLSNVFVSSNSELIER